MYKFNEKYLMRTDLRQEGRDKWNTRRRNKKEPLPFNLENLAFRPEDEDRAVVEFLKELASFPDAAELYFSPGDLSDGLEQMGGVYADHVPIPSKLESVQVNSFTSSDGRRVNYAIAELNGNWGYLAVSEPVIFIVDGINRSKVHFFYSPVPEGKVEFLERIRTNPLNPDISNLKYSSTEEPSNQR
jgi:hypothetical protein